MNGYYEDDPAWVYEQARKEFTACVRDGQRCTQIPCPLREFCAHYDAPSPSSGEKPVEPQSPGVPREPTEAMVNIGRSIARTLNCDEGSGVAYVWRAMYDARPQEGAPGGQGEGK